MEVRCKFWLVSRSVAFRVGLGKVFAGWCGGFARLLRDAGRYAYMLCGLVRFIYIWDFVVASKLEDLFACGQSQLILVPFPLLHLGLS